ncbi:hypothetical protein [Psychromicrobium lacuslunae]|uniref:hypothetical protein n=1 Tax=Psychromicrobium lacuslunae TaxID=1618207 RepID=UPI000697EAE9|nr:hypothetical protein [Psychromicrobium lacuslunae]
MHSYLFHTVWLLPATPTRCWQELVTLGSWEHWWPALAKESWPASPLDTGSELWLGVRSPLGYRLRVQLTVQRIVPESSLSVSGSGDLSGSGDAQFLEINEGNTTDSGPHTELRINWSVQTTKPWMNFLAPLAAPGFRWAHNALMRDGERRFRKWLREHPAASVSS